MQSSFSVSLKFLELLHYVSSLAPPNRGWVGQVSSVDAQLGVGQGWGPLAGRCAERETVHLKAHSIHSVSEEGQTWGSPTHSDVLKVLILYIYINDT